MVSKKRPGVAAGQFAPNSLHWTLAVRTGAAQQSSGPGARASVLSDGEVAESRDRQRVPACGGMRATAASTKLSSKRAQEVQQGLLIGLAQLIEVCDHLIGFRPRARVLRDSCHEVVAAAVMQEEQALADTPQRRRPELLAIGIALGNVVSEPRPHSVEGKVTEWLEPHVAESRIKG
jgi:hypothetical protein